MLQGNPGAHFRLSLESELFDQGFVRGGVLSFEILEVSATVSYELQESSA